MASLVVVESGVYVCKPENRQRRGIPPSSQVLTCPNELASFRVLRSLPAQPSE